MGNACQGKINNRFILNNKFFKYRYCIDIILINESNLFNSFNIINNNKINDHSFLIEKENKLKFQVFNLENNQNNGFEELDLENFLNIKDYKSFKILFDHNKLILISNKFNKIFASLEEIFKQYNNLKWFFNKLIDNNIKPSTIYLINNKINNEYYLKNLNINMPLIIFNYKDLSSTLSNRKMIIYIMSLNSFNFNENKNELISWLNINLIIFIKNNNQDNLNLEKIKIETIENDRNLSNNIDINLKKYSNKNILIINNPESEKLLMKIFSDSLYRIFNIDKGCLYNYMELLFFYILNDNKINKNKKADKTVIKKKLDDLIVEVNDYNNYIKVKEVLKKLLNNIINNSGEKKFRRINKKNKTIIENITKYKHSESLVKDIGFSKEIKEEGKSFLINENNNLDELKLYLEVINNN